ncbi:hypothetical protein [Streptomyces narbonensis]|uniref:hypothetical protein n=2 Tax=Streptomyces narbonensis TaxID=67333 RepID=UPI001E4BF928|nr:hypothetical protein [Streptomyces narbonensis]
MRSRTRRRPDGKQPAMSMEHTTDGHTLLVSLPADLDVTGRAMAALRLQTLVLTYRPRLVRLSMPACRPTAASLSVLARLRRLCDGLGIFVALTTAPPAPASAAEGTAVR